MLIHALRMNIIATLLLLLSIIVAVFATETTVPFILWTPKKISIPHAADISPQVILGNKDIFADTLTELMPELCSTKVLVIVDQPGIYTSDMSHPDLSMHFSTIILASSPSSAGTHFTIPHVRKGVDVNTLVARLEYQCGSEITQIDPANVYLPEFTTEHTILLMRLPPVGGSNPSETLSQNDRALEALFLLLPSDYIGIYTSSPSKTILRTRSRRQVQNGADPTYIYITPGIQMTFGAVIFFVLVLWGGLVVVTNIKSPVKFEDPKTAKKKDL